MKIIKKGTRNPVLGMRFACTCKACLCEFEFHEIEGKRVHDQRDGDYLEVMCPDCSTFNNVSVKCGI
jgi:phage FluMu protein Com